MNKRNGVLRRKHPMPFTYPGGKRKLAEMYRRYYPPHNHFVSLFGGSGAEFLSKEPSPIETYNDKDDLIYDVFAAIQGETTFRQLLALLENTPDGRTQYEKCHDIIRFPASEPSLVRRAWAYLVCANIGYHGPHPVLTRSWAMYRHARYSPSLRLIRMPDTLRHWRDRFRRVRLENATWQTLVQRYDSPETFFFADPPYCPGTYQGPLYRFELTIQEHIALLEALNRVQGFVLLCGIHHPLYEEHLFHWRQIRFQVRTTMGRGKYKPPRQEEIWLNYEADGSKVNEHKRIITERYVKLMGSHDEAERQIQRHKTFIHLPR